MKPRPDKTLKTKLSQYERSLLISQTTVKLFKFEDGTPPVGTNMDFNVSIGFLVRAFVALQSCLSKRFFGSSKFKKNPRPGIIEISKFSLLGHELF